MLITNHVVGGAIIGSLSSSKRTAFAVGIVSHFALDAIPHMGVRDRTHFLTLAVIDGLIGAAAMAAIAKIAPTDKRGRVVAGMLGACLPDADKPSREFFGGSPYPKWLDRAHDAIQTESPDKLGQEVLLAVLGGVVLVGTFLRRDHSRRGEGRR
ncbi:MAG: hypothetical protein J2P22_02465 [Nocardioides sp.]|nr:hypothetical protein [Nocardioides sp.]